MADELFNMIRDAYIRGATWYRENDASGDSSLDIGRFLHKAAYDYADKTTGEIPMTIETELPAVKVKALPEKPKPVCRHVHDHVICAGRGSAFNVYRCRYCGDEEWL